MPPALRRTRSISIGSMSQTADVLMCLRFLTEIDQAEYQTLEQAVASEPHKREAQRTIGYLADRVRSWSGWFASCRTCDFSLFSGRKSIEPPTQLCKRFLLTYQVLKSSDPFCKSGLNVGDAFVSSGLCKTKSEAKRTVQEGGAYVNNRRVTSPDQTLTLDDLASETTMVLRRGKKNFALLRTSA